MGKDIVVKALRTAGGPKRLARLAGVHVDTASDWLNGKALPRADVFVRLMKRSQEIARAVYSATTHEWLEEEESRLKTELAALQARRANDKSIGPVRALACRALESVAATSLGGGKTLAEQDRSAS